MPRLMPRRFGCCAILKLMLKFGAATAGTGSPGGKCWTNRQDVRMIPPESKLLDPAYQRDQFEKKSNRYSSWLLSALGLINGAHALREKMTSMLTSPGPYDYKPGLLPSMFLLYGFSIECLLKALYVKNGNELASNGRHKSALGTKSHDLVAYAQAAGFELTPDEQYLLRKLSTQIKGFGRYPTGMSFESESLLTRGNGDWEHPATYRSQELLLIDGILSKIEHIFGVPLRA